MRTARLFFLILFLLPLTKISAQIKGSKVVVRETDDADRLNPYTNFSAVGGYIDEYLYSSLIRSDMETLEYLPLLASGPPKISEDKMQILYTLDDDAKFNSGKKVTPEDVIFSVKMLKNPFLTNQDKLIPYKNIRNVEPKGDQKIVFSLVSPSPSALHVTGEFSILPKDYFDSEGRLDNIPFEALNNPTSLSEEQKGELKAVADKVNVFGSSIEQFDNDATCGPYLLTEWKKGKKITLEYNKKFWGRKLKAPKNRYFKQNIETIEFLVILDETKARQMIFEGEVDIDPSISAPLFFELSELTQILDKYRFLTPTGSSYEYVGLNMEGSKYGRAPFLEDLKVRQAMAHLVNIDQLLETAQYGYGERIASDCQSPIKDFYNSDLELIPYDVEQAKKLLKEAGWEDTDGDGVVDKVLGGKKVQMELDLVYGDNREIRKQIAKSMAKTFPKAGVKLNLVPMPFSESLKRVKRGDYDLMLGAWVSDPNEDSYDQIWHSKNKNGGSNWVGYGDENTDQLIQLYDTETDVEKRKVLAHHIQQQIYDAQPYVFLWKPTERIILSKKYKNAKAFPVRPGFWIPEWVQ